MSKTDLLPKLLNWRYLSGWSLLGYVPFLVVITSLALSWSYQGKAAYVFDFNSSQAEAAAPSLAGFYKAEHNAVSGYRWTHPKFEVTLAYLASQDYKLTLRSFGNPAGNENKPWTISVDGQEVATFVPTSAASPQSYNFTIPARLVQGDLRLQFSGSAYTPKGDNRVLGLPLTYLELQPLPTGWVWPPLNALLAALTLAILVCLLVLPFWKWFGWPANWWLNQLVVYLSLGLPALYVGWSARYARLTFANDLDNLNYGLGRLALGLYCLIGLAVAAQVWLKRKPSGAKTLQTSPISVPADPIETRSHANRRSIEALTGLRYLAALLVFLDHLPIDNQLPASVYHFIRSGYVGVGLFFVLSGFVLCYNYYDTFVQGLKKATVRSFWVARFARIYPMYIGGFIFSLLLVQPTRKVWAAPLQLALLQSFSPDKDVLLSFNSPAWSVSVEAFFYLVFPFIVFFAIRRLNSTAQILITGAAIVLLQIGVETATTGLDERTQEYLYYDMPLGRLVEFALGMLVALLYMRWQNRPVGRRESWLAHLVGLAALWSVLYLMSLDKPTWQVYRYGIFYALPFACIVFYLARYPSPVARLLAKPGMLLLGESSYGFYLLHNTVLGLLFGAIDQLGYNLSEYLVFAAQLIIATLLAVLAFTFYETPARFWIRKKLEPTRGSVSSDSSLVGTRQS